MMSAYSIRTVFFLAISITSAAWAGQPFLDAATYAGGAGLDQVRCMDVAPDGSIYIAGYSDLMNPLPNALNTQSGAVDIFVMKLSPDMTTLYWSKYMGGTGQVADLEFATDCAATDDGIIVTGKTETPDFPAVNAIDSTLDGPSDAVLFKLDSDGNTVFSTYIGGSGGENAEGAGSGQFVGEVEVASDGSIFVAGDTRSPDFPLVDPIDGTFGGFQHDGFVMKLSGDGQTILASSYFGDEYPDQILGMALDGQDRPVIVGTAGPGWPFTAGAYSYGSISSNGVVFVTKLASDARSIEWSSRIGRVDSSGGHLAFYDVTTGPDGTITVVGEASGSGYPVPSTAFQTTVGSGSPTRDAIALTFSADGNQILAGTFLGLPNVGEIAEAVGVDSFGQVLIPINILSSGSHPCRLYKLDADMTMFVEESILLAHPGQIRELRMDSRNNPIVAIAGFGDTTIGAFQESPLGVGAPYVARWNMLDPPDTPAAGDINGDGTVDDVDAVLFTSVLLGTDTNVVHIGRCDLNADGVANGRDAQPFVSALLGN